MMATPFKLTSLLLCACLSAGSAQDARKSTRPASDSAAAVFRFLAKEAGVTIITDGNLYGERLPMPGADERITADNIDAVIARMVKKLPDGFTWGKVYLPKPPDGKSWKSEDVIAFVRAQARLYGIVGKPGPKETVEILSVRLPLEKAQPVITALDLKPIYILAMEKGNFTGTWTTTFGEMRLTQSGTRVTGKYTQSGGEIQGTVSGDILMLRWYERDTDGSGRAVFRLGEDGNSFTGLWNSSAEDPRNATSQWTGQRTGYR